MALNFMENGEFQEGIRSILIDKDRNPKWKHNRIKDVTPNEVKQLFESKESLNFDLAASVEQILE